jgi:hypothetical protein
VPLTNLEATMLYPSVRREWNGIYIEGQQIGLVVQPHAEGTITVDVIALSAITGFDRPSRLLGEDRLELAPHEVAVHDTRLECFAADKLVPSLRQGFALDLEPGMAQQLRAWLPRLIAVASASKAVADKFNAQVPPPIYHMLSAITSVVARIVLASWEAEESVAFERRHGVWGKEDVFMNQFDNESVKQELIALAEASHAAPKANS